MIHVEAQVEGDWDASGDWRPLAERAVVTALRASTYGEWIGAPLTVEISVRFTGDDEVQALNARYRGKDAPTNVLSFPMVQPDLLEGLTNSDDGEALLGDIILAHGVCAREAAARGLSIATHASHLIVHGIFHLLGYDHVGDAEAEAMEALERAALAAIGIADPYAEDRDQHGV
ncbi:MAG: rRNA maturation RNase YbeY [Sphingomonadaceae bacterium]|nr:rRNA maturation RNase YbeY [Sphingomonadaceae bacterium]